MIFFHKFYRNQFKKQMRLARIEIRQEAVEYEAQELKRQLKKPELASFIAATAGIAHVI